MLHIIRFGVLFFVFLLFVSGCKQSVPYDMAELEGTASYKGQPLENVVLTFSSGSKRPSIAVVSADGKFKAVSSPSVKGVPIGKCVVRVGWETAPDAPPEQWKELFDKYGYESDGLEIDITKSNKNYSLNFE
ncbi:MAG: hypothetical protein LBU34_17015 [Planctomycetaceae bacterium]|nr:hypothetical protein [Planctomycetaceae bacterium]